MSIWQEQDERKLGEKLSFRDNLSVSTVFYERFLIKAVYLFSLSIHRVL